MMELIKEDTRGKVFETDSFKIFYRKENSVSGDNSINPYEKIVFLQGRAKITLKDDVFEKEAPFEIEIPEKTYHKIEALSDIIFIISN